MHSVNDTQHASYFHLLTVMKAYLNDRTENNNLCKYTRRILSLCKHSWPIWRFSCV